MASVTLGKVMSRPLRSGAPEEAGMSSARLHRVAQLAGSWVAQGMTPALVVLIARRGIIVLHEAFGRLDPASDSSLPLDAVFPLGLITKAISAATTLALVEDGILGLNRAITDYLPELVGEGKEAVMVHHLMTHTSGFRDEEVAEHIARKRRAGTIPTPARDLPWRVFSRSLVESRLGCAGRQACAPGRLAAFQRHVRTRGRGRCGPMHRPRQRSHPGLFLGPDPSRTKDWLTTMARRPVRQCCHPAIEDG